MEKFVLTEPFKSLNIGFSLDEGIASPTDEFNVYYAERTIWQITFRCIGRSGHGSMLFKDTPGEKINYIVQKLMEIRKREVEKLDQNPALDLGDVTSVNLTILSGGQQENVIPPEMSATFDIRLSNDIDLVEFEKLVNTQSLEYCFELDNLKILDFGQDNRNLLSVFFLIDQSMVQRSWWWH